MSTINDLNKQIEMGILPNELNFSCSNAPEQIDISKLQYNAFYRSYDFYANKFPIGMVNNLPGFDKVLNYIVENKEDTTPLKEIEEINQKEIIIDKLYSA